MAIPRLTTYRDNLPPSPTADFYNAAGYIVNYLNTPSGALTGGYLVGLNDVGNYFPVKNVEDALQFLAGISAPALATLTDVELTSPIDGDTLSFHTADGKWKNDGGFVTKTGIQTLSNKTLDQSTTLNQLSGVFFNFHDVTDPSKRAYWDLSKLEAGFQGSIIVPEPGNPGGPVELLGVHATQTIFRKSINGPDNTITNWPIASLVGGPLGTGGGGTGIAGVPSANFLLGSDIAGTAYEGKELVAGTNMTITHGVGSVTFDAAASPLPPGSSAVYYNSRPVSPVTGDLVVYTRSIPGEVIENGGGGASNPNTIIEVYTGGSWISIVDHA